MIRRLIRRAVHLQLGLAGAEPAPHAAALLRHPRRGAAAQPRQPVAQQGQFDLGLALQGVRVLGEDVEDHRGAVDRRAAEQLLQVVLLRRRQLVVEHDRVGVDGEAQLAQLLGLALAQVPGVVRRVASLHQASCLVGAGRVDQQGQLVEAGVGVLVGGAGQRHPDEHDALPVAALDERGTECFVVRVGHVSLRALLDADVGEDRR